MAYVLLKNKTQAVKYKSLIYSSISEWIKIQRRERNEEGERKQEKICRKQKNISKGQTNQIHTNEPTTEQIYEKIHIQRKAYKQT